MSNVTNRSLTLSWDAHPFDDDTDISHYYVDMKEEQDLNFTPAGRVDGHIHSFKTDLLQKGKLYHFRVKAKNSAGFSEPPAELPESVGLLDVAGILFFQIL